MYSVILSTAIRYLIPILLMFSFFLLLRGHNEPGGGFAGGLVAASSFIIYALANGVESARKFLRIEPLAIISVGLSIALLSGIYPMFFGEVFLTGMWFENEIPVIGKLGTPFVFDVGVYFLVLGITVKIIFNLAEE